MDTDRNHPAVDLPEQTTETLDPTRAWTPRPSAAYGEFDRAHDEGAAARPDPLAQAEAGYEANREHAENLAEMQGCPFVEPAREHQETQVRVKTDLPDLSIGLRSGQGQSGFGEPPVILPTRGPEGEISIIELPPPRSAHEGT